MFWARTTPTSPRPLPITTIQLKATMRMSAVSTNASPKMRPKIGPEGVSAITHVPAMAITEPNNARGNFQGVVLGLGIAFVKNTPMGIRATTAICAPVGMLWFNRPPSAAKIVIAAIIVAALGTPLSVIRDVRIAINAACAASSSKRVCFWSRATLRNSFCEGRPPESKMSSAKASPTIRDSAKRLLTMFKRSTPAGTFVPRDSRHPRTSRLPLTATISTELRLV